MNADKAWRWTKRVGALNGIGAALLVAANVSWSGWGFVAFLVSATTLTAAHLRDREGALAAMQGAFAAINMFGILRWLVVS